MRKILLILLIFLFMFPVAAFAGYQHDLKQEIENMKMERDKQKRLLSEYQGRIEQYIKEVERAKNDNLSNLKQASEKDSLYEMYDFFGNKWYPKWLDLLKTYKNTGLSIGLPEGKKAAAEFRAMKDPQTGAEMGINSGAYESGKYWEALNGVFYSRRYIDYYNSLIGYALSNLESGISMEQFEKNLQYFKDRNEAPVIGDPFPYDGERTKVALPVELNLYDLLRFIGEEGGGTGSEDVAAGGGDGGLFAGGWKGEMAMKNVYADRLNSEFGLNLTPEEAREGLGLEDEIGAAIIKGPGGKYEAKIGIEAFVFEGQVSVNGNRIQITFHDSDLPPEVDYVFTGEANSDGSKISGTWKLTSGNGALAVGNWYVNRVAETVEDTGSEQAGGEMEDVPSNSGGDPAGAGASGAPGTGQPITPAGDGGAGEDTPPADDGGTGGDTPHHGAGDEKGEDLSPEDRERKKAGMTIFDSGAGPGKAPVVDEKRKAAAEDTKRRIKEMAERASMVLVENAMTNVNTGVKTAHLVRPDSDVEADREKEPGSYFEEKYKLNEKILNPLVDKVVEKIPGLKYFGDQVKDKKDDIIFSDEEKEQKKEKDTEKKIAEVKKEFNVDEDSAEGYARWCDFEDREKKLKPAKNMVTDLMGKAQKTVVAPFKWTMDKLGNFMKKSYSNAAGKDIKHIKKLVKDNIDKGKPPGEALKEAKKTYTTYNIDNVESIYGRSQATLAWNSKGKYKDRGARFDSVVEMMKKDGEL